MPAHLSEKAFAEALATQPKGLDLFKVVERGEALMDFSTLGWTGKVSAMPWAWKIVDREIDSDDVIAALLRQMHLLGLRTGLTVPMSPDQLRADREKAAELLNLSAREIVLELRRTGTLEATELERRASADGVAELIDFFLVAPPHRADWLGYGWLNGFLLAMRARGASDVAA